MVSLKHLIDLTLSRAYDPTFSWSCFYSSGFFPGDEELGFTEEEWFYGKDRKC